MATHAKSNGVLELSKKDFVSDQDVRWCPGCGDYAILAQVQKLMPELGKPREDIVFISGIGCSSRFPYYMNTYGFHTIHGRAPAVATGLKVARPELTVFVVTGDGDGLSIGGNHLIHALRRNIDLNILLFNNRIYGLTKGQYSPTSEIGKRTKSTPLGSIDRPFQPASVALGAEATFVARTIDTEVKHQKAVLKAAAEHKGSSFVEIYQNCNVFNDDAFTYVTDRNSKAETQLILEHGKPLLFGNDRDKGIRMGPNFTPEVVEVGEGPGKAALAEIVVHDETTDNPTYAFMLSRLDRPDFPVPLGVMRRVSKPSYDAMVVEQNEQATKNGSGNVDDMIRSGEFWTLGN